MCEEECPTRHITTLHTYTTEFNADSVEWCPHAPFQNILVCANYQLKDSTDNPERFGCILLFSVDDSSLHLRQTIKTAGVLDQKWCHNLIENRPFLGVVTAENSLEIYDLNPELIELGLVALCKLDGNALLLSLDWSTGKNKSEEPQIVCSDSKGGIHLFRFKDREIRHEQTFRGHDFEAWIAAFYYWDPNVFFSGGDDCRFLKFDQRTGFEPISSNKSHEAGVTSMHSNSSKENIVATGSYDSNIRIWDIRKMKNCISLIKMPGTLWRLKFDPFSNSFLLAACMLGGVHIVNSTNFEKLQIVDSYYQHKNIAYGADWSHLPNLIASCSFYDNLLCISEVKLGSE